VAFFTIRAIESRPDLRLTRALREKGGTVLVLSLLLLLLVAFAPLPFGHQLMWKLAFPQFLAASCGFFLFILTMSQSSNRFLINPVIAGIGKVSFSAYLLHFAVIKLVMTDHAEFFHIRDAGWSAIVAFLCSILVVTVLTCLLSAVTYTLIEKPMTRWAKKLTRGPARAAQAVA
jgi:peptidoglycan/LPS O-acetylase OafA/YrhL